MTPEQSKIFREKFYNFEGLDPDAAKKWSKVIAKLPDALSGHQYALQIHKGTIDVCTEVRQAVNRYFRDIERAMGDNPPFYFEAKRVFVFFKFIREMKHVKGPLRGKKFEPEPWQCWMFLQIFGWHIEEGGTIKARFRRVYTEVPRGNGKSFMLSGVTLFGLSCDGEGGPEIVSAATSKDQAKIVWEDAKRFVVNDPEFLQETLGIVPMAFEILHPRSDGTFKPLANEGTNHDGLNPHIAAVDELHAHKDRSMYDVLETALGKRYRSLLFAITTAGGNTSGICYEIRTYIKKILNESAQDDSFFGIVYTMDEWDDWKDPKAWAKANPNWGVSVMPDIIKATAYKAQAMPSSEANFKTKHLNIWVNAMNAWMDTQKWKKCETEISIGDLKGESCYLAVDLASKVDIAAMAALFPVTSAMRSNFGLDDRVKFLMYHFYWLPEARVAEASGQETKRDARDSRNDQYYGWAQGGIIKTTPGEVTRFETIEDDIEEFAQNYDVTSIGFDPFQAAMMSQRLEEKGFEVWEFRNTVLNMSEPMKEFQSLTYDGVLLHEMNPCTEWQVLNVVAKEDAKGNIFPNKERPENKIDGAVAGIMALGIAMQNDENAESIYAQEWWNN